MADRVSANKKLFADRVSANKKIFVYRVSANKKLFADTPHGNFFLVMNR